MFFSPYILHVLSGGRFFCSPVPSSCCSHLSSERHFLSTPSAGISFSPDSSSLGRSLLSHALLALLFQETQPAGKGTACSSPFGGDPLKSVMAPSPLAYCIPLCLDEAGCFRAKTAGGHRGARYSLLPFLHVWLLQQGQEVSCFPNTWEEAGNLPAPLQKPRDRALSSLKPLRRSSWLLQGGAAAGAAGSRARTDAETGREMRWLT